MSGDATEGLSAEDQSRVSIFQKVQVWVDAERFDLAERTLIQGLREHPNDPHLHAQLALILRRLERTEEAESHVARSLALAPNDPYCLFVAGQTHAALGRHREAEQFYIEALRQDPTDAATLMAYGALMQKTGHLDKAQQLVETSLRFAPENEAAHGMLAVIHAERRRPGGQAMAHGSQSLQFSPDSEFSHSAMAYACLHSFRPFQARQHAREALRLNPADNDTVQLFQHCDFVCRWTYLPMYYLAAILSRLPGEQFALWGAAIVLIIFAPKIPFLAPYAGWITLSWVILCVYTWIAHPLTKFWMKVVPTR
ncbi:MAG: hypothetical protein EA381_20875 [Planctomycetaceae bacterium]|nr:MAG: hypothetical protein EA381_20875 [Planctomycetaceae bacterium]